MLVTLLSARAAGAAPTLAITSPPPGSRLYDVQPTLSVVWTSTAGVNLDSLSILVNGADWTSRFTKTPVSASYAVASADALVAGELTISATIVDLEGTPASTSQSYEVFPTLVAFTPAEGRDRDQVTVEVLGLDPDPAKNTVVFPPCVERPLDSVDIPNRRGILTVPLALSGRLRVVVNGKASEKHAMAFEFPPLAVGGGNMVAYTGHALFATMGGASYGMGSNIWSQLGGGASSYVTTPTRIPLPGRVGALAAGSRHSLVVTEDGQVWGFGRNNVGQLGDGTLDWAETPRPVVHGYRVRAVAAFADSSFALTCDGKLLAFGWNGVGELGIGGYDYVPHPIPTPILSGIRAVSGGGAWTIALAESGTPYGWGWNVNGQAGNGSAGNYVIGTPLQLSIPTPRRVSVGGAHALSITADGLDAVSGWGADGAGQVGNGPADNPPPPGYHWVLTPEFASGLVADEISAGDIHSHGLRDGQVTQWGAITIPPSNPNPQYQKVYSPQLVPGLSDMVAVAGGKDMSLAWKSDGTLWTWGWNGTGALGDGTFVTRSVPQVVFACTGENCTVEESVRLLPSTTRWKPWRSDSPVEVRFESAFELSAATLYLAGPGAVLPVPDPPPPLELVSAEPNRYEYRLVWSGPWSAPGTGERYPVGDYQVRVRALRQSDEAVLWSAERLVSLMEVTSVTFRKRPNAPALDANPVGHGGGLRLRAEALEPINVNPDREVFDRVDVLATVAPAVPDAGAQGPVTVYFRSFDVDDPAEEFPVDADGDADPNFVSDNRDVPPAGWLTTAAGQEVPGAIPVALPASPSGIATTTLRTSRLPGDNYVVAASTSEAWLNDVRAIQPSLVGEIRYTSGQPLAEADKRQLSHLLAVWRTLHVPLERMDHTLTSQDQLELRDAYDSIAKGGKKLYDSSVSFRNYTTPDGIPDHPQNDDWRGAQLADIAAGSGARVTGNGTNDVSTATPPVLTDPQQRYRLFDDELGHLEYSKHDVSILSLVLWPLFVAVDTAEATAPAQVRPFFRYLSDERHKTWAGIHVNDAAYWSVPLVLAFDSGLLSGDGAGSADHDPGDDNYQHESARSGQIQRDRDQPVAAVFTETIHDFKKTNFGVCRATVPVEEYLATTQAHEVIHALRVNHGGDLDTGMLMCANSKNDASIPTTIRWQITPEQRAVIRGLVQPTSVNYPPETCCPIRPGCPNSLPCLAVLQEEGEGAP